MQKYLLFLGWGILVTPLTALALDQENLRPWFIDGCTQPVKGLDDRTAYGQMLLACGHLVDLLQESSLEEAAGPLSDDERRRIVSNIADFYIPPRRDLRQGALKYRPGIQRAFRKLGSQRELEEGLDNLPPSYEAEVFRIRNYLAYVTMEKYLQNEGLKSTYRRYSSYVGLEEKSPLVELKIAALREVIVDYLADGGAYSEADFHFDAGIELFAGDLFRHVAQYSTFEMFQPGELAGIQLALRRLPLDRRIDAWNNYIVPTGGLMWVPLSSFHYDLRPGRQNGWGTSFRRWIWRRRYKLREKVERVAVSAHRLVNPCKVVFPL